MTRRHKTLAAVGVAAAALGAGGVAIASTAGDDEDRSPERPIAGSALDRARSAALEHVGPGRVTGTEVDDEEGVYEVEVTRADGSQVDVHLDRGFKVNPAADDDERGDREGRKDDADSSGDE
jgi:uncharacterized membrane protein YkoI